MPSGNGEDLVRPYESVLVYQTSTSCCTLFCPRTSQNSNGSYRYSKLIELDVLATGCLEEVLVHMVQR
jgi:hypothetical protein